MLALKVTSEAGHACAGPEIVAIGTALTIRRNSVRGLWQLLKVFIISAK